MSKIPSISKFKVFGQNTSFSFVSSVNAICEYICQYYMYSIILGQISLKKLSHFFVFPSIYPKLSSVNNSVKSVYNKQYIDNEQ